MFQHIPISTDGSELSEAVRKGIGFAKDIKAKVTSFHAMPAVTAAHRVRTVPRGAGPRRRGPAHPGQARRWKPAPGTARPR